MLRVVVLGGAGNFGARIVRALQTDPRIELLSAGRRAAAQPSVQGVRSAVLDMMASDFPARLKALEPGLVIHCVGPFQGQDYRVAQATLAAGAHYLDLSDGREFVAGFAPALHAQAERAGRVAISGVSTLPALSTAVIEALQVGLSSIQEVEIAIAPGQKAPRGVATLAAVFSYLGRPVQVWEDGTWRRRFGWMDLRRIGFAFGSRWGALCDVPDLELLPRRFPALRTARFHAALEFSVQHLALWKLAAIRRLGLPLPVDHLAMVLSRFASGFDPLAGEWGGMRVSVLGQRADQTVRRTWQLKVPALDGPEIPCMAAILLARRIAGGGRLPLGAFPCMGFVSLGDFAPEFARWGITTQIEESAA